MRFHIRAAFSGGRILHTVEIAKETPLYAPDLRGISLENAQLDGADLRHANLCGVCLRGARLRGALLDYANLTGADLSYCNLAGASMREANLSGTVIYPAETIGANYYGAKFAPDSDAAEYARMAQEEMCRRNRNQAGFGRIPKTATDQWMDSRVPGFQPKPDLRPAGRASCFVEVFSAPEGIR